MEIYFALRFCKIDLYISICLYALDSYFLVLSRYFGGCVDCEIEKDLLGDFPLCLLIFFVSSSFCRFRVSISSRFICVSFFILCFLSLTKCLLVCGVRIILPGRCLCGNLPKTVVNASKIVFLLLIRLDTHLHIILIVKKRKVINLLSFYTKKFNGLVSIKKKNKWSGMNLSKKI